MASPSPSRPQYLRTAVGSAPRTMGFTTYSSHVRSSRPDSSAHSPVMCRVSPVIQAESGDAPIPFDAPVTTATFPSSLPATLLVRGDLLGTNAFEMVGSETKDSVAPCQDAGHRTKRGPGLRLAPVP